MRDALAHNLEAFCAPGYHPMADGMAIEGMKLIKNSLFKAFTNGKDVNARMDLLSAASMGSTAFQKGLGAIHSLSHPVNGKFNVHHGLSNAIFMPYVLTFNKTSIENNINIPHKLSDVMDCNNIDLDELSLMAFEDPSTGGNPKKLSQNDLKEMYIKSISGELF